MARKKTSQEEEAQEVILRPVTIDGFFGHARQVALLGRLLEKGMVASSLLFSGPASVGKASLAFRLAAALQCEAPSPWACGRCVSCIKAQRGVHPDIRAITLEVNEDTGKVRKEIVIRQAREEIIEHLSLPPYEGRKLLFIVDPAEALNTEAQNALLKSLEEPPAYGQFILITANAANLLPTVRSRCQEVTFGMVPLKILKEVALSAGLIGTEAEEAALSAAGAPGLILSGSFRDAAKRRMQLLALMEFGLKAEHYPQLAPILEELAKEPPRPIVAEALRLAAQSRRALATPGETHPQALLKAAQARKERPLARIAERLAEAPAHLERNVNPRLLLDRLFLTP